MLQANQSPICIHLHLFMNITINLLYLFLNFYTTPNKINKINLPFIFKYKLGMIIDQNKLLNSQNLINIY